MVLMEQSHKSHAKKTAIIKIKDEKTKSLVNL